MNAPARFRVDGHGGLEALDVIAPLVEAGMAIHWLKARSKAPLNKAASGGLVADDWAAAPVYSLADLTRIYRPGYNVGVRLGEPSRVFGYFLDAFDMDIRAAGVGDEARAALAQFLPEYATLPFVISGSGGESRHFYLLCEQPFRSRKLAHSAEKFVGTDGKQHWAWELELLGSGKQVVLPPSIHPDTGLEYAWGRPIEFGDLDLGIGPFVDHARVAKWAPAAVPLDEDDDDGLTAQVRAKPMGLSPREIAECLAGLPLPDYCEDRAGWLTVGMALHHEFEGSAKGLATWNAFSKQSPKFDEKDQARVWKSFESSKRPTRMATLIKAAAVARLSADMAGDNYGDDVDFDEDEDETADVTDDMNDLLGAVSPKATDLEWTSLLDVNKEGAIKPTLHNIELILKNDVRFRGLPRRNEFTLNECYRGEPGFKAFSKRRAKPCRQLEGKVWQLADELNGDLWIKPHTESIRSLIEAPKSQGGYSIKVTDRDIKGAIEIASYNSGYHPIQEYLNSLEWDGKERLETLYIRYLGVRDSPYHRATAKLPLVAAVTRIFEPGHKWDYVPIIEGAQGIRKSSFVAALGKHWSAELNGDFSERQKLVEKMQGAWVLEIPELSGFSRHEVEDIKAAVSATSDKVRLSYRHDAQDYKRQSILYGTTNSHDYLRDSTGGRRFWPIRCEVGTIDIEALESEVDQLWAEATRCYRTMRQAKPQGLLPLYLSGAAAAADALAIQETRRVETQEEQWADAISLWLDKPGTDDTGFDEDASDVLGARPPLRNEVTLREVWVGCFGKDIGALTPTISNQLSKAMGLLNWTNAGPRRTASGKTARIYRRN